MNMDNMPLKNIVVLECGIGLTAPFASSLLGDLGANVIKIESPRGDVSREWPPLKNGFSYYYAIINRNKKNIVVNLKSEEGRNVFLRLARKADIIIENFTPGTTERLGIGYEDIKKVNPKIIYCSISGFGQESPYKYRPAFDYIMQGETGWMSHTGTPETPCRIGIPITDFITALYAFSAVLIALLYRERMNEGVFIDIAMFDCQLTALLDLASIYWVEGRSPGRRGYKYIFGPTYQPYLASDGKYLILGIATSHHWKKFCELTGLIDLYKEYPNIADMIPEDIHRKVEKKLVKIFSTKPRDQWIKLLTKHGIPCGAINDISDVLNHPQTKFRKMIAEVNHEKIGKIKLIKSPFKFTPFDIKIKIPPSLIGEHTEDVLNEFGFSEEEIQKLKSTGVICSKA